MVNKPSNAQRNLAVSFTTCVPQLLAHLHPGHGHLCNSSHHPTTHPTTCAPNFAATYATSIQVLSNPQEAHKHVSWGILCTFIAATHEATTPPTSFLYDQASNILHVCALQDPQSSLKHLCSLAFACLLSLCLHYL